MSTSKRPSILLTGARGQVGFELAKVLSPLGDTVATGREDLDLTRVAAIRDFVRALKPSIIVNAAAYTDVEGAQVERELAEAVNAIAPEVLAQSAEFS